MKEYIDRALSAKTDNRPDFQRMIKDSAKGLFDVVVVWKLDRFARNRYDSAHYKAALKKNGVRVISAKENIADGPEGIILESMLEGMAEYYSTELSVKVIRGHTENALKCKYNGGTPTFGFAIDADKHYQSDPITAPIVLDIFKMYDTGSTMKQIVDHLNGLGVTTVRGKPADLNFISGILHNRKYIGEYQYRDIVVPNGIPALVPTDLFERVQDQMKKNKKAPARHKAEDDYLLTTKLFCGTCKAMMVGESGTSGSQGRKYHYYRCVNSKKRKICTAKHKSVRKEPLEQAVVSSVMRNIMDDAFVEYFVDQALALQGQESNELPSLRRQLADTEKAIDNMLNAIQAGIFNASTKRRLDELEATKEKLELSIIKEEMKKPQFTREQIQFYILQFRKVDTNTLEGRRRLIDGFVNSVVVYDDYILVTFNYKEGAERITFEQIERSDLSSLGGGSQSYGPGGSGDSGSYSDEDDQDSYSYGYDDDFYSWLFGYEYDPEWYLHDETLSEGEKAYYHYEANYYNWDGKSMETYDKVNEQYNRIAANPSAETAAQEMVWVEIPVWRLVNGQKVPDTDRVQVMSSIADEVKAIFTEIYNGPEQFPINSIGGYSWRSNGLNSYHSSGLAIDINPDQNPQVRSDGTVLVGSKWEPGVNPYSISQDSDVVKAFGKYGWTWGAAFTTKDYMHFEY